MNIIGSLIQHISTITFNIRCMVSNYLSTMVLSQNFNGKVMFKNFDFGMRFYLTYKAFLNLKTGVILVMKNAMLRVSTLTMKVEKTVLILIKVHAPVEQLLNL